MPIYDNTLVTREQVDALSGLTLLEFGVDWCPHCQRAQAPVARALSGFSQLRHIRVEDGKGRPLGRSFAVKLWPALILLRDGQEVQRVLRPTSVSDLAPLLPWLGPLDNSNVG